jgi:hypothetical protein
MRSSFIIQNLPASAANWPIVRPHSQKGPNKKWSSLTNLRLNKKTKRAEKGPSFRKIVSLLLSPLILRKSKKKNYFPTHTDKNSVFLKLKFLQKMKITGDRIFFLNGGRIFILDWPKSSAKSWQHCE